MTKRKILLVDDEVQVARALKMNLDLSGRYQVRIENQGSCALEAARDFEPDLIVLDIIMPDMRGDEVLRLLRQDERLRGIPVIFLSALGPGSDSLEGLTEPWIAKPASAAEVMEQIERALGAPPTAC
jgi:CheY-like chemotaxis protein